MKQIIIVPSKETPYSCSFSETEGHYLQYQQYAIQNNLPFLGQLTDVVHQCAKVFSFNDYVSVILDSERIVCFCTDHLSKNQYQWFKEKYSFFSRFQQLGIPFSAIIFSYQESTYQEHFFEQKLDNPEYNPLKHFYKEIKKYKEDINERTYRK